MNLSMPTDIPVRFTRCLDHYYHFTQRWLAELKDICKRTKTASAESWWRIRLPNAGCLSVSGRRGWATRVRCVKTHRKVLFSCFLRNGLFPWVLLVTEQVLLSWPVAGFQYPMLSHQKLDGSLWDCEAIGSKWINSNVNYRATSDQICIIDVQKIHEFIDAYRYSCEVHTMSSSPLSFYPTLACRVERHMQTNQNCKCRIVVKDQATQCRLLICFR